MDDKRVLNKWNSSTSFLVVMVGAIIGLSGIWKFSYIMYENGGGAFLIPYILAIIILAVPIFILEFGIGFKFKSSLPKIFYNIKPEFEFVAWFVIFLIFMILVYYVCTMSWDIVYFILSLFKGWGNNPGGFFTTTLLHSTSNSYGLSYLVVPIGIGIMFIWAMIYLISRKEINKGILTINKIALLLVSILLVGLLIFTLQLPGSRTGVYALFVPNWGILLDYNVWLVAFGQLIFSYGLGYGIASTYSSYISDRFKLIDSVWIVVLVSLLLEVLVAVLVFAILGHMALGNGVAIASLFNDGFSLIFVVFPYIFNLMGPWVYIVAPAFFGLLFVSSLGVIPALIEPLSNALSEKFGWSRNESIKKLVLIGLFASFVFATGMGKYLIQVADTFICNFAIILALIFEIVVITWVYDIEGMRTFINNNSFIKIDKYWIILVKILIPVILIVIWVFGVYNLIISGDRQSLFIQSIIAALFVIIPLVLTVMSNVGDFSLDFNSRKEVNYFKGNNESNNLRNSLENKKSNNILSKEKHSKSDIVKTIDDYDNHGNPNLDEGFVEDEIGVNRADSEGYGSNFEYGDTHDSNRSKKLFNRTGDFISPYFNIKNRKNRGENNDKSNANGEYDSHKLSNKKDFSVSFDSHTSSEDQNKKSNSLFEKINLFNKNNDKSNEEYEYSKVNTSKVHNFKKASELDGFDNGEDFSDYNWGYDDSNLSQNSKQGHEKSDAYNNSSKSNYDNIQLNKDNSENDEDIEYEDFTDEFFDDGVFDDGDYTSLLDDYVEKSKNNLEHNRKNNKSKYVKEQDIDENKYYDFEGKGADSVFNLED